MSSIIELDKKRFNAYVAHTRLPEVDFFALELEWYGNRQETVIGALILDKVDNDYSYVVLGRDEGNRFRSIDVACSIPSRELARELLKESIERNEKERPESFFQGDSKNRQDGIDLFASVTPPERQHPYFKALNSDSAFQSARCLISEIMPHYIDVDNNFVEQFQSTGFDSRTWELYLNSYFIEEKLAIDKSHSSPDFLVSRFGIAAAVEAVIVGRKAGTSFISSEPFAIPEPSIERDDAMAIRFGSSLLTKVNKNYWELPHVQGKPLVLAIADFHDNLSMLWSSTALISYLYGVTHEFHHNASGELIITPMPINSHKGSKIIKSGFFFQENSRHISAVMTSSCGTISKFNRLGRQAGFGDQNITMIRSGTFHDHDPNSATPRIFQYVVGPESHETWGEGMSIYHNPNALIPLQVELFPSVAHHWFRDGQLISRIPAFHTYSSQTYSYKYKKPAE